MHPVSDNLGSLSSWLRGGKHGLQRKKKIKPKAGQVDRKQKACDSKRWCFSEVHVEVEIPTQVLLLGRARMHVQKAWEPCEGTEVRTLLLI